MKTERHGYMFTNKHNTTGGKWSTFSAVIAFLCVVAGIVISYKNSGNAGIIAGALGTAGFVFSTAGLILGLRSFKEKDRFYMFSWIGSIGNGVIWTAMCLIIASGFMTGL